MRGGVTAPPMGAARPRRRPEMCPGMCPGMWWTAVPLPAAALALLAAVAMLLAATAADAQSVTSLNSQINTLRSQISTLNNNVAGLRAQLSDLEKAVHTGRRHAGAAPTPHPTQRPRASSPSGTAGGWRSSKATSTRSRNGSAASPAASRSSKT